MTPALRSHLKSLSPGKRAQMRRDSRKAIGEAWPYRHTAMRARIVLDANVRMLRNLNEIAKGA